MTLSELKKIIQDKYLHTSKPVMKKCDCTHFIKGVWDSCETCGHPNAAHNTGICIATWEEGGYTLSSGAKSDKYFDIKGMMGDYTDSQFLMAQIKNFLLILLENKGVDCGSYGGVELGGVPIVAEMHARHRCFIRKQSLPRQHGLKKRIEGCPKSPILLVDDILSTGNTAKEAAAVCIEAGYDIAGFLCVVNRMERDDIADIPVYSLFHEGDFT